MSETTYYQRNREVILNGAKDCYENNKELFREGAKNKYRELSEEDKKYKKRVWKRRCHNMFEENKKRLKEYQKNYREGKKTCFTNANMSVKVCYKYIFVCSFIKF